MGGVLSQASCSAPGAPLPPLTAAPPPKEPDSGGKKTSTEPPLKNPGEYEELGKKVKEQLSPQMFDGAKVIIQKGLSKNFQTMHTLTLASSTQPSQWQFGATYVGTKKISENDFRPIFIGDIGTSGNFTAVLLHQLGDAWRLKVNLQTQRSRWVGYVLQTDYVGSDFTASASLANPDLISGSGVFVAQYLQSMTSRLALGCELLYQRSGGMQNAMISLGGCYRTNTWEAAARLGLHSWNVSYQHRFKDSLTLYTDIDGSLMQGETSACVGYKLDLGSMSMKGKLSSGGVVTAQLEKRMDPLPATLMLSGQINHWTDESRFGVVFMVG